MQKRYYDVRVAILMWHVIINVCDYHQIFKCNVPGCVNGCFVVVGASAYQFGSCVENVPQIYTYTHQKYKYKSKRKNSIKIGKSGMV